MKKNILLPTDFSEYSWNAIQYALRLFREEECHFILLNTYTPVIFKWEYVEASTAPLEGIDDIKELSESGLHRLLERIQATYQNPKHTFSCQSSFNTLALEIDEIQEREPVDMVIMGTQGASGVKRVLFGSNTIHVLKTAKCPVLAVPNYCTFEKIQDILFPSDFLVPFQKRQLQPMLDLANAHKSNIQVLHVMEKKGLSNEQKNNKDWLMEILKRETVTYHEMPHQNVPEAIASFQRASRVDLLVLLNNKHSFFTNLFFSPTVHRIGFHLSVPFLVIPTSFKGHRRGS